MKPIPISAEQSPLLFLELLYKLRVRDVMVRDLVTIRRDASMRDLQRLLQTRRVSGVPVVEDKRLYGIISIEDLIQALEANRMDEPVSQFMATQVITVDEDMPLSIGLSTCNKYEYRRFPVLNARKETVGIVTARSINTRLLMELFKELGRIENEGVQTPVQSDSCSFNSFRISPSDFENAGKAATEIKTMLQQRGVEPKMIRRVAIAAYELEMNLVVHSDGGTLTFRADEGEIQLISNDQGPGIEDVNLAMQEGWTTANEWVRSLGFGAGMGLPNAKRVSDEFHITSEIGAGTTVTIRNILAVRPDHKPSS